MNKARLEAFSDGVIAIIITIMVLELKVPRGGSPQALRPLLPVFLSYILSFVYVGIYWNNHHHMLHTTTRVTGAILWANLHLLFWLSLFPFATGWLGENHFAPVPTALYGIVLLMAAIAYYILQQLIIASQGPNSLLETGHRQRLEGQALAAPVCRRHRRHRPFPRAGPGHLRLRRPHVARPRPPHRARSPPIRTLTSRRLSDTRASVAPRPPGSAA